MHLHGFPLQVLQSLQRVNFTMPSGEQVYFNANGDPTAKYELVNWQKDSAGDITFVSLGYYDASLPIDRQFVMNSVNISWAGTSNTVGMEYITQRLYSKCVIFKSITKSECVSEAKICVQ